jgi:ABC-type transporter Mla subunit MlaD
MISISSRLSAAFKNACEIIVVSADDMALALANVPAVIDELILLLDKPIWKSILTKLGEFKTAWGALSKETKDSIDAFNDIVSTLSSLLELSDKLSKVFTETGDIVVTSANDMATALAEVPDVITQLTELLGKDVWKNIIKEIIALDAEWKLVSEDMESSLESFTNVISAIETLITLPEKLATTFGESGEIVVTSANDMATALAEVPAVIIQLTKLLGKKIWTSLVDTLKELDGVWSTMDEEVLKSIDAFSKVAGSLSDIVSLSRGVSDTFTDMEAIVVYSAEQMAEALKEIPEILQSMTEYLGSDSFKGIKNDLAALSKEYKLHKDVLKEVMPSFEATASMLGSIISNVIGLSEAFKALAETTIVSSLDMERAMENVDIFIGRFAKEMHFSLDDLVKSLSGLDSEWKLYSKDMENVMPSFKAATGDIMSLVQGVLSLSAALENLSKIGIIGSQEFDKGFSSLITSIVNFSSSLKTNVKPLIESLKLLRNEWVRNAATLEPLMTAFMIITHNFTSLAVSANNMITSFGNLSKNSGSLEAGFNTLIKFIKNVEKATGEFYTPENAAMIARYIEDVETVITAFRQLEDKIEGALNDIENAVSTSVDGVKGHINSLSSLVLDMNTYGANAVISFASGMHDYLWVVEEEALKLSGILQGYLGVESPTELGPLKYIEDWPKNLVKTFASGIQSEMSTLNASFSGMTLGVSPDRGADASVRASSNVTFNITQNITDRPTADYANRELKTLLKHEIM